MQPESGLKLVPCPHCGIEQSIDMELAGSHWTCTECNTSFPLKAAPAGAPAVPQGLANARCPHCLRELTIPRHAAGEIVKCTFCANEVVLDTSSGKDKLHKLRRLTCKCGQKMEFPSSHTSLPCPSCGRDVLQMTRASRVLLLAAIAVLVGGFVAISVARRKNQPVESTLPTIPSEHELKTYGYANMPNDRTLRETLLNDIALTAYRAATNQVASGLAAPRSAIYSTFKESQVLKNGGQFYVKGVVDSQNAFGAMLRHEFEFWMQPHSEKQWSVQAMRIGETWAK